MTKGCLWGWFDKYHAGMDAAIRQAIATCSQDEIHVMLIEGTDLDVGPNSGFDTISDRRNEVVAYVNSIKKELKNNKIDVYLHEYATLDDAVADGHNYDFDVIFVVAHDMIKSCYTDNLGILNANRIANGKAAVTVEVIPTVYEDGTDQVLSGTKVRKRANQ